jgi:hypothetical protein
LKLFVSELLALLSEKFEKIAFFTRRTSFFSEKFLNQTAFLNLGICILGEQSESQTIETKHFF